MTTDVSRRALLGAGFGLLLSGVAGCSGQTTGAADPSPSGSVVGSAEPGSASASSAVTSSAGSSPLPAATVSSVAAPSAVPSSPGSLQALTTPGPGGPAIEIGTGPPRGSLVALTFHGGGDPATATAILDICAQRSAAITVLAIGTWLQENPAMAAAILAGGHDLGNHTWSHQVLSDLDQAAVRAEITRCRDLLVQLTGSPGTFFRTSSGQHASPLILDEAGAAGYPVCLSYDVDPADWTDPGIAAVRSGAAAAVAGSIVSLHFGHEGTVQALPGILDDLAARGLRAVTASTLLAS